MHDIHNSISQSQQLVEINQTLHTIGAVCASATAGDEWFPLKDRAHVVEYVEADGPNLPKFKKRCDSISDIYIYIQT